MLIEKLPKTLELGKNIKLGTLNEQIHEDLPDPPHMHNFIENGHS